MSEERFEQLAVDALSSIPAALRDLLDNVALFVDDDPPPGGPVLLGLYEGVPLTRRDSSYAGVLPDRIFIFRNPILAICDTEADVVEQVRITLVHEVAHHFGIDDDSLHAWGYA
ncbi:MAG: metallopeptidase family protein [Nocardioidaceae bacterium]